MLLCDTLRKDLSDCLQTHNGPRSQSMQDNSSPVGFFITQFRAMPLAFDLFCVSPAQLSLQRDALRNVPPSADCYRLSVNGGFCLWVCLSLKPTLKSRDATWLSHGFWLPSHVNLTCKCVIVGCCKEAVSNLHFLLCGDVGCALDVDWMERSLWCPAFGAYILGFMTP